MLKHLTFIIISALSFATYAGSSEPVKVYTKVQGNGVISPEEVELHFGDQHTIYITPAEGSVLQSISGCNGLYENGIYHIVQVTENCMVSARFSIGSDGIDSELIGNNSTIDIGAAKNNPAAKMSTLNSNNFSNGTGAGLAASARRTSGNLLLLLIAADAAANLVDVTANVLGVGGTITPATQKVRKGAQATFIVTASAGFRVSSIQGCGISSTSPGTVTSPVISAACNVTVVFERLASAVWDSFSWDNSNWG